MPTSSDGPRISVALPIRNGMPHLKKAIEGLFSQTYKNFELFVQDAVSTDGTLEYLQSLDAPFKIHIVSEPDGSLVKGYNRALLRCTGDLVVCAATDEVFDPTAFQTYVGWHHQHPDAVFIYGGSRIVAADGSLIAEFQPKEFTLVDYLRHNMCPTIAGVFNKVLLGEELHMDESLDTVPDFELITRMALTYGQDRILCKEALTMSALGDRTSMSFRPEAYIQFARDKEKIIDRLVNGEWKEKFKEFVKQDILYGMYISLASLAEMQPDGDDVFRELLVKADNLLPGHHRTRYLATMNRRFEWDDKAMRLKIRHPLGPEFPPSDAEVISTWEPAAVVVNPYWERTGASVTRKHNGALIRTPNIAWHYAAAFPIDCSSLNFERQFYWVKLTIRDVTGIIRASFFDEANNRIFRETVIPEGRGPHTFTLEMDRPFGDLLLFRTGENDRASSAVFVKAELLTTTIDEASLVN